MPGVKYLLQIILVFISVSFLRKYYPLICNKFTFRIVVNFNTITVFWWAPLHWTVGRHDSAVKQPKSSKTDTFMQCEQLLFWFHWEYKTKFNKTWSEAIIYFVYFLSLIYCSICFYFMHPVRYKYLSYKHGVFEGS